MVVRSQFPAGSRLEAWSLVIDHHDKRWAAQRVVGPWDDAPLDVLARIAAQRQVQEKGHVGAFEIQGMLL